MNRILIVLLNVFRQILKCKRGDLVPCGRHPCLLMKREELMINSGKHKLLHDYYQSNILFHKKLKSFLVTIAIVFLKI